MELPFRVPDRPAGVNVDTFVAPVPDRGNAVVVVWLGGMCDEQIQLEYTGGDRRFTVTTVQREGGCRLAAIGRGVIVVFSSAVEASGFSAQDMD